MLRLAIALSIACFCAGQRSPGNNPLVIEEKNVLSPPYFNIAAGKQIATTATCGTEGRELFCKLTGGTNFEFSNNLHQGQVCDVCDANVPEKSHKVQNAIDGTEKWWQSPPLSRGNEYNKVNLTIHLGQVFHVAYVLIKFANSPRAGTWVLERSSDNGKTFQPWQYFANTDSDCYNLFGMGSLEEITRDDSVVCTSDYSGVVPLENGEVIVSMIKGRPGANNFSYSTVLQEWSKATDVRLRFIRTKTLLGHLMAVSEQDPTVTRRYYYSIKDISIGGRCVCNGHADRCLPDPLDKYKLKCECQHNTCGDSCEYCCPGFVQKAWRVAVPESTNECEQCNCHGHSTECGYDEEIASRRLSLDIYGNYEGGGVCQNCSHNTAGINCEQCASGYWRLASVSPRDPNGCRACDCDSAYTVGSCEPNTGRCYCKVQYAGDRCDRCAPGYYDFPECRPCDCNYNGTLNDVCLPVDDAGCPCKYNFAGKYCDECAAGFYKFPECLACECNGEGVASDVCDAYSGECPCAVGFSGSQCTECAPGYFNYPVCQRCACSDVGTTDKVCDSATGICFCEEKYSGRSCDDCRPGYYGFPQCQECQCTSPGSVNDECDTRSGRCICHPNYRGERCDECAPEYYGYPNCVSCVCNVRGSLRTTCDQTTGQCLCRDNIGGRTCDQCTPDYFNFPRCEECSCDPQGIVSVVPGVCLAFTTGQCECKENVVGKNCDMCAPLHYDVNRGCISCNCFIQGTLDGVGECDGKDGSCWCKPYTCSQRCSQCEDGFFALEELNYFGCTSCQCDVGGSMTSHCDKNTGQCVCKSGVGGRRCDRALDGYFFPTLYQNQYEAEDGRTPENTVVRAGFDQLIFPNFSMTGYAQFSVVQRTILIPVIVHNSGLYRVMLRYVNTGESQVVANVTLSPNQLPDGTEQSQKVVFDRTSTPRMLTVPTPFVLNKGTWTLALQAAPGLLVDYLVLLPSQYYEPGILELSVTLPCVPSLQFNDEECVMVTHPSLDEFVVKDLVRDAPSARVNSPSTSHPEMLQLNGVSGINEDSEFTTDISLPSPGKYVLVLEYASDETKFQMAPVSVTDGTGNTYNDARFNVYSCLYSFTCRQVALGVLNDVMVFDMSLPVMKVNVKTEPGGSFHVKSLTAIPYEQWTMEWVDPKPLCITTKGPAFDECLVSSYTIPFGASRFDVPRGRPTSNSRGEPTTTTRPNNINDADVPLVHLDGTDKTGSGKKTLQIPMNLTPGRYVFLIHYYNPDHTGFNPDVVVDGGVAHTGSANVSYCPNADGCRAVVITDEGQTVLDITVPTTTFTMVVPDDKAFWVQYVLAVPENEYTPSILKPNPIDKSGDFVGECSTDGQQSFLSTVQDPTDFCKENVFSLTVNYNDGGVSCECSGAGTIGGGDAICEDYGGQCPCKPNVIGRQCDRCMTGFYGYPDCQPCDCDGRLCDEVSGACICPPNTVQPACDRCAPFTHSFHPLLGCVECDCHIQGVVNITDRGCDSSDGQCRCKEHVTGQRCDRCDSGYFGFPNCRLCTCDDRGSVSDKCDHSTGQCLCKENVEGLQCDRCQAGSFQLDINNPLGCTECFCFGASNPAMCHSSQFPSAEVYDMQGWRLLNLVNPKPEVVSRNNGRAIQVLVTENGGQQYPSQPNLYWAAPKTYLGDAVGSYGGELRFTSSWSFGRGDNAGVGASGNPAPLLGRIPDLLLKGNQFVIGWVNPNPSQSVNLELSEKNFQHEGSGNDVTRPEMMMVLADLQALHIRAAPEVGVVSVMLQDVVMMATDYNLPIGSAPGIPAVEECTCPEGYNGHSCQNCDPGYYRVKEGPYLGYCRQCECFPFCLTCDDNGQIRNPTECLYNTGGPNCGVCEDGFIGNTTSGGVEACKPCPCPFPQEDGNFADTCEEQDGELICHCQTGYTGERCESCAPGYFGNPAVVGGSCQECNCHGNLDPNLIMPVCDSLTGECSDCSFNTGGKYCERCADGYYGDAHVAKNCRACDCHSCGTEACDDKMGFCSCKPHVIGGVCDTCEPGYFGFQSCAGCRTCNCDIGALGTDCDIDNGQCRCAPNIVGLRCDKCAPGFWDYSSSGCTPCNCRNNGRCNPMNGLCECPPGITGAQCDQCELSRHILLPGTTECTRCGSCTDDLLNDVEPLTDDVRRAMNELANISVGVVATQRLQKLMERAKGLMEIVDGDEDLLTTTTTTLEGLINGELDEIASDVSGSGHPEDLTEEDDLDRRITKTDDDVTEMCNHTKTLLRQVQLTENMTMNGVVDSGTLQTLASEFQLEAKELLDSLNEESSGDSEEYFQKLKEAEMLLQEMKERDFAPMKKVADDELALAEKLLRRVEGNFTDPAMNASSRVDDLVQQLNDTHAKLRDLIQKINEATQNTNDATTANAVNGKNLTSMQEAVTNINADVTMANEDIADAQQLLATAKSAVAESIPAGIEELDQLNSALEQSYNDLLPVYEQLLADIEQYGPFANQSTEKKNRLEADAQAMADIAGADLQGRINAVNRFGRISQTIAEAEAAAEDAVMASRKAKDDIESKNLQDEAAQAQERSSELLTMTQDLSSNNIPDLNSDLEDSTSTLNGLEEQKIDLMKRLNLLSQGLDDLDRGTLDGDLADTNAMADAARQMAEEAGRRAQNLEDEIKKAPDRDTDLERELEQVSSTLEGLPGAVLRMNETSARAQQAAETFPILQRDLRMKERILDVIKRIELTRNVANMIKDSVKFFPEDPTQFVEVRTPNVIQDEDKYVEVKFATKIEPTSASGHLMYLGDGTGEGDYMSVETVNGRVRYNYKVGDGSGQIESAVQIHNDQWTTITVVRFGKVGKLIVEYPITDSSRGDASASVTTNKETLTGATDGEDVTADMNIPGNKFFIGGNPSQRLPPAVENGTVGHVCVADVKMNNETIGLWNFKAYRGRVPAESCATGASLAENLMWRFRGQGSYVRIRREDTPFMTGPARAHFIGFKLSTLQDNSLIFLVGETIDQFIALQVIDGKFVYSFNFGFDRPNTTIIEGTGDIIQSDGPLLVKAGLAPAYHRILLSVNLEFYINRDYDQSGEPNIVGDIWLGGLWYPQSLQKELRDYLQNIDISFRGCIQELNFNSRSFNIQNAIENIGVTRGCKKESVRTLTVQGNDYVKLVSGLDDVSSLEGGLTLNTATPTGTMLSATETQATLNVEVAPTNEAPSPGDDELNSDVGGDEPASDVSRDNVNGGGVDVEPDSDNPTEASKAPPREELPDKALEFEADRYAAAPPSDEGGHGETGSGSMLPVVLIVIGVVVAVVLLAAIVSTILKSSLMAGVASNAVASPPPHAPAEATPLNSVQAQRTAQMDW